LERLRPTLAVVVVVERAEPGLATVDRPRVQRLPGAVYAELTSCIWGDATLAAFAPGRRPAHDPGAVAAGEHRDQAAVLIVRMRADVKHVAGRGQAADEVDETRRARAGVVTHRRSSGSVDGRTRRGTCSQQPPRSACRRRPRRVPAVDHVERDKRAATG